MSKLPIQFSVALVIAAQSLPAIAKSPVSLNPFAGAISFSPHRPKAVTAGHPLAASIVVDPIVDAPAKTGIMLNTYMKNAEINEGLVSGLRSAGMVAADPRAAKFRLTATWLEFNAPFRISFSSKATVIVRYELRRIDTGAVIFSRDVTTFAKASGGEGSARQKATARASVAANFAGTIHCLQEAAYGRAPQDCAVSPVGSFSTPMYIPIYVPR